jgi:hypothetical protein
MRSPFKCKFPSLSAPYNRPHVLCISPELSTESAGTIQHERGQLLPCLGKSQSVREGDMFRQLRVHDHDIHGRVDIAPSVVKSI